MKKRGNDRRHKHLLEKDYMKSLMANISTKFDLNKQSWLVETIVKNLLNIIEPFEIEKGIDRMKPREIKLSYKNRVLTIPLYDVQAIKILVDVKIFAAYKERIVKNTLELIKNFDQNATIGDVYSLISHREIIPRYQQDPDLYKKIDIDPSFSLIDPDDIGVKLTKPSPFITPLSEQVKNRVIQFLSQDMGLKPFIAQAILKYFLEQRALFLPLKSSINLGQMVWLGTNFKKSVNIGCTQIRREQTPIILTLYSEEELETKPTDLYELNNMMMKQLARITTEAYLQETLLPGDELQLFFLRSYSVLGKLIRKYMHIHKVILPTPGTILDAGTTFTHKELIIDLHMQGYYTKEIARKTYHDPRSVDSYLKTFNSILILWYFNLPNPLISMVTEKGQKVINEHLNIITKYFSDRDTLKQYLKKEGIAV